MFYDNALCEPTFDKCLLKIHHKLNRIKLNHRYHKNNINGRYA